MAAAMPPPFLRLLSFQILRQEGPVGQHTGQLHQHVGEAAAAVKAHGGGFQHLALLRRPEGEGDDGAGAPPLLLLNHDGAPVGRGDAVYEPQAEPVLRPALGGLKLPGVGPLHGGCRHAHAVVLHGKAAGLRLPVHRHRDRAAAGVVADTVAHQVFQRTRQQGRVSLDGIFPSGGLQFQRIAAVQPAVEPPALDKPCLPLIR